MLKLPSKKIKDIKTLLNEKHGVEFETKDMCGSKAYKSISKSVVHSDKIFFSMKDAIDYFLKEFGYVRRTNGGNGRNSF